MKNLSTIGLTVLGLVLASSARAQEFSASNLVTSNQSANAAVITDSGAVNSWGISLSSGSPFWVAANGSGLSNLYTVNPTSGSVSQNSTIVTIPGVGSAMGTPTGTVFNGNSSAFNGDKFLFVSLDGTISGWTSSLGTMAAVLVPSSTANVYTGCAEVTSGTNSLLYATNFSTGSVDVYTTSGTSVVRTSVSGGFTNPNTPAGYAPYNIQYLGGNLFVTYAEQNASKNAAVWGAGLGYVAEFDPQGDLLAQSGSNALLNAPWGLAIAPSTFGSYAGDLLVGNFGGGVIDAFDLGPGSLSFVGQLPGPNGQPLTIGGLWALNLGNGGNGGSKGSIYFTAGPQNQTNGLFGVINPVPEPSTFALLGAGATALLGYVWRRRSVGRALLR